MRIFIYGTLMRGEPAHALLGTQARFERSGRTAPGFALVDLGAWPGLVRDTPGGGVVSGELFVIAAEALAALDAYEDCPGTYTRESIALDDGSSAVAWLLRPEYTHARPRLPGGDWRARDPR